jgi:histidinol-phosphate aminotransferase
MNFDKIIRQHILNLTPYSSARDEYSGKEGVFLDANENALGSVASKNSNRYPDPYQWEVKHKLSKLKNTHQENIFLGNGSDEAIDLLIKVVCEPKVDNIIILPPTYGMYKVCADIQQIEVKQALLTPDFQIDIAAIENVFDANTKIIWVCSPNNPSGNLVSSLTILELLNKYPDTIIVVDEAYIDFANQESFINKLSKFDNLFVLQTFSKAWGMAGLRIGVGYGHHTLIKAINKIKYPYNLNLLTQIEVSKAIDNVAKKNEFVEKINNEKLALFKKLVGLSIVRHIYPSDSNQLLVKFENSKAVFKYLLENKIIVRDRSNVVLCEDCIRISIGTKKENQVLFQALKLYK